MHNYDKLTIKNINFELIKCYEENQMDCILRHSCIKVMGRINYLFTLKF